MSRTVACTTVSPPISILVSVTVAGNSSPPSRLCVHSNRKEPSRSALSIISLALSADDCPSGWRSGDRSQGASAVSYTHLRAHETRHELVCRLLLEKKKK